uniref:3-hydroxyisobutyrate dehydrogenase-like NAD-binding domain-containing protein n=1 Tax=Tetradesmus obliquus TaxID=3088 RepID=A0A383VS74_TETOB|eukprot:jgi/Sobl393_1/20130/SZX67594.1
MVGGNKAAAEAAAPILRTMGSHIIHCGDHGAGISAKLCNNLVLAASMAALAEALALGKRMGLDPAVLTDALALAKRMGLDPAVLTDVSH